MPTEAQCTTLRQFRQAAYACLGPARDAQFELVDAVVLTPAVRSVAELSVSPVFRRRWPSAYEALQDGPPDREGLLSLYATQRPSGVRPLLAGDHSAWPRLSAPTLRERTVGHQPTPIAGQKPIPVGQGYSPLAGLPPEEEGSSWAVPLLHERIGAEEAPSPTAIEPLRRGTPAGSGRPIRLGDSE